MDFSLSIFGFMHFLGNFHGQCAKIKGTEAKSSRFFLAGHMLELVVVSLISFAPLICSHLMFGLLPLTLVTLDAFLLDSFSGFDRVTPSTTCQHSEYERARKGPSLAVTGHITV